MLPSHGFGEDKMTQGKNRQWLLSRRPRGAIGVDDLRLSETDIPEPGEGEILVHNIYLSCDPTQRGWMARDTYMPMIPLGEVVRSFAGGEVVRSRDPRFVPGQRVQGLFGWQDYAVAKQSESLPILAIPDEFSIPTGMSALGLTGLTAYFGLLDVGGAKAGETVVVSGAAGHGEYCPRGFTCSDAGGFWMCGSKVGLGGACGDSLPCLENLRCSAGLC